MVLSFCNTYQYLRSEEGCLNYILKLTLMLNKMYMVFFLILQLMLKMVKHRVHKTHCLKKVSSDMSLNWSLIARLFALRESTMQLHFYIMKQISFADSMQCCPFWPCMGYGTQVTNKAFEPLVFLQEIFQGSVFC